MFFFIKFVTVCKTNLMKKVILLIFLIVIAGHYSFGQFLSDSAGFSQVIAFQKELNMKFLNPEESPLKKEDLRVFKELDFFPVNLNFKIIAEFKRVPNFDTIKMKTTTSRTPDYFKYAELIFYIDSNKFKLNVYQNLELSNTREYQNSLFLPFTDLTTGGESYGGGRYIDLEIPQGKTIVLDFNSSYNPYCAYDDRYSCPVPPAENFIEYEIKAGVKNWKSN